MESARRVLVVAVWIMTSGSASGDDPDQFEFHRDNGLAAGPFMAASLQEGAASNLALLLVDGALQAGGIVLVALGVEKLRTSHRLRSRLQHSFEPIEGTAP